MGRTHLVKASIAEHKDNIGLAKQRKAKRNSTSKLAIVLNITNDNTSLNHNCL